MDGFYREDTWQLKHIISQLEGAKDKLAPIVDDIILSAATLIERGDNRFLSECKLTPEQCEDIVWASEILKDVQCHSMMDNRIYRWPNTDFIVNNVSVGYIKGTLNASSGKSIVIDEATVVRLLEVYEQMGEVIQTFVSEANRQNQEIISHPSEISVTQDPSRQSITAQSPSLLKRKTHSSLLDRKSHRSFSNLSNGASSGSIRDDDDDDRDDDDDVNPAQIKSTLSVLIKSSSGELNKEHTPSTSKSVHTERHDECTNIYIRIQCLTDPSDDEYTDRHDPPVVLPANCDHQSTPHYHIRLGGEPVTLKIDQTSVEDGAVYCINTGIDEEDNDVKIVIKQCPECFSTVIGSTTKIKDMLGESHESVTLHGKSVMDETILSYEEISSPENTCSDTAIPSRSKVLSDHEILTDDIRNNSKIDSQIDVEVEMDDGSKLTIGKATSGSRVELMPKTPSGSRITVSSKTPSGSKIYISQPQLSIVIDEENVDRSSDVTSPSFTRVKSSLDAMRSKKSSLTPMPSRNISPMLLRGKRLCSSMEFDVKTVHTRLRDQNVEHTNPRIVVELRKMGVDQLLRACRPAKCCRKAILNERQRTGLPYCVSLKSLPLMDIDAEVIQQSYEMSVKKTKNALDLTENHKETLAYYISLGRDDFRPNINFPWVVPVYDVKLDKRKSKKSTNQQNIFLLQSMKKRKRIHKKRFFVLKKPTSSMESRESAHRKRIHSKRFFILKKRTSSGLVPTIRKKKHKFRRGAKVHFKEFSKTNVNYLDKLEKWNQSRGIFNRKSLYTNFWNNLIENCKKHKSRSFSFDFESDSSDCDPLADLFNFDLSKYKRKCLVANKCTSTKNILETGNFCSESACKILGNILKNLDIKKEMFCNEIAPKKSFSDTPLSMVHGPRFSSTNWNHVSENLFYKSSDVTIFVKRRKSVGKIKKAGHNRKCLKIEDTIGDKLDISPKKEQIKPKEKLEFYVGLLDGDLVWGQSLPLVPHNSYDTYFNHDNVTSKDEAPRTAALLEPVVAPTPPTTPQTLLQIEDQIEEISVNTLPENDELVPILEPKENTNVKEINVKHLSPVEEVKEETNRKKNQDKFASQVKKEFLEPESPDQAWAPYVVSRISLPVVYEQVTEKVEAIQVEAAPPRKEVKIHPQQGAVRCNSNTCTKKKKPCGEGVIIDIKQITSKNNTSVEATVAGGQCTKEVCEIYKNKQWVQDDKSPKQAKVSKNDDQTYTIMAKDNVKIVIDSRNVSVTKRTCGKSKETKKKDKTK